MANRFPLILNTSSNQIQEIASGDQLDLTGNNIANAGIITASTVNVTGDLDVDGHINLDNVSVSGVLTATTFSGDGSGLIGVASTDNIVTGTAATFNTYPVDINAGLTIAGVSTFTGALNIDSDIDVDGHTNLDNVSIAGVTTFTSLVDANGGATIDNVRIGVAGNNEIDTVSGNLTIDSNGGTVTIDDNLTVNDALTVTNTLNANGNIVGDSATNITGIAGVTASTFTGTLQTAAQPNITSVGTLGSLNVTGNVSIGGTLTYEDVTNIDSVGIVTARNGIFVPDSQTIHVGGSSGSGDLQIYHDTSNSYIKDNGTGDLLLQTQGGYVKIRYGNDTMALFQPSNKAELYFANSAKLATSNTGVTVTGTVAATAYTGDGSALTGISVGISTNAQTVTNGNTLLLDLTKDDHKVTATGTVTISCTGGTEGDSHTVRIVNSGITTVGFSTYFLFPSGGAPNIPITSGTISLISFTVHRAGAVGVSTQLLSGASVSFA